MRKLITITCVLSIVFLFVACQNTSENTSSALGSEQQSQSAASSLSESAASSLSKIESNVSNISQTGTELLVTGVVKDATMNFVVITTDDNKQYSFFTSEADKSGLKNGLLLNMRITVFYTEKSNYPNSYTATKLTDA